MLVSSVPDPVDGVMTHHFRGRPFATFDQCRNWDEIDPGKDLGTGRVGKVPEYNYDPGVKSPVPDVVHTKRSRR